MAQHNIPAPEEYTTLQEFKDACKPSFSACDRMFRTLHNQRGLVWYYRFCWQQPEAELIHQAFEDSHG